MFQQKIVRRKLTATFNGFSAKNAALLCLCFLFSAALCPRLMAQNVVNDLLAGKLIDPKVGQWVWYDLKDKEGNPICGVRQAIVGQEKVGGKQGFWVEFEIVPKAGYRSVYKVLVTGPASDPRNVKRVIHKQGLDPVQEIEITPDSSSARDTTRAKRKSLGMEPVETGSGIMRAEHLEVVQEDRSLHIWVNEEIKPSSIVRLKTEEGEMVLRSYGAGGTFGESTLDSLAAPQVQVQTSVQEKGDSKPEEASTEPSPTQTQNMDEEKKQ